MRFVPSSPKRCNYFVHQSVEDDLLAKTFNEIFPSGKKATHYAIFSRSLKAMSRTLRRDVYSLRDPGISIDQVEPPGPNPLAAIWYSCLYWEDHLIDCDVRGNTINDLQNGGSLHSFLNTSYLYWLEALSLMKSLPDSIVMILKLENQLQVSNANNLRMLLEKTLLIK